MTEKQNEAYALRVLSGEQAQSEITLRARKYTLGASTSCDIVLEGENIQEHHANFFFSEGKITFLDSAPLFRSGASTPEDGVWEWNAEEALRIGETWIAYGKQGFSDPSFTNAQAEPTPENTIDSDAERAPTPTLTAKQPHALQKKKKKSRLRQIIIATSALTVLSFVAGAYLFGIEPDDLPTQEEFLSLQISPEDAIPSWILARSGLNDKEQELAELLNSEDFNKVRLNGTTISGLVNSTQNEIQLRRLADQLGYTTQVLNLQKIRDSLTLLLVESKGDRTTQFFFDGDSVSTLRIGIRGVFATRQQLALFRAELQDNFGTMFSVTADKLTSLPDIVEQLEGNRPHIVSGIRVELDETILRFSGSVLGDFENEWRRMFASLDSDYGVVVDLHNQVEIAPRFNARVVGVAGGATQTVALQNRDNGVVINVRVGSTVQEGLVLDSITDDLIKLRYRDSLIDYPIKNDEPT